MSRLALAALLATVLGSIPAVHAQAAPAGAPAAPTTDWTPALNADLPGRLGVEGKRVLVLSGARDDAHRALTRAVKTALSRPGGAVVVLDDQTAPDAVGKPDSEALAATAALPVDVRVLARIVGPQGSRTAVLSVYDPAGAFVSAVSMTEKPAAPVNAVTTPPTAAPDARAGEAAVRAARKRRAVRASQRQQDLKEAIAAYENRYLWVEPVAAFNPTGVSIDHRFFQGIAQRPMSLGALYHEMNAKAPYERLQTNIDAYRADVILWSSLFLGLSVATISAGTLLFTSPEEVRDALKQEAPFQMIGVFLIATGVATLPLAPLGLSTLQDADDTNPHLWPEKPRELHARIKAHNAALAKELGLEDVSGLPTGLERL